jgi:hypothetical protein
MIVIGIHGAKSSGKDYAYQVMRQAFPNYDFGKLAFADPIKAEVCRIFGLLDESQYDMFKRTSVSYLLPGYESRSVPGRQVVREIGMLMRQYDENQFTRYVADRVDNGPENRIWVITDVRFDNEVKLLRRLPGGKIIKVVRDRVKYDGHVTEQELPDAECDAVVHNCGTAAFAQRVVDAVNPFLVSKE